MKRYIHFKWPSNLISLLFSILFFSSLSHQLVAQYMTGDSRMAPEDYSVRWDECTGELIVAFEVGGRDKDNTEYYKWNQYFRLMYLDENGNKKVFFNMPRISNHDINNDADSWISNPVTVIGQMKTRLRQYSKYYYWTLQRPSNLNYTVTEVTEEHGYTQNDKHWYQLWVTLRFSNLPPEIRHRNVQFIPEFLRKYHNSINTYNQERHTHTQFLNNYRSANILNPFLPIQGLTASTDTYCDKIRLNWSWPTVGCNNIHKAIIQYRSTDNATWSVVDNVPFSSSPQYDFEATPGIQYEFRILHTYANYNFTSYVSNIATGRQFAIDAPTNLYATMDRCDQSVRITWDHTPSNPDQVTGYRVQRRIQSSNGAFETIAERITTREFIDRTAIPDVPYLYRVQAFDQCNRTNSPDPAHEVIGLTPGNPEVPSNLMIQVNDDNSALQLTWEQALSPSTDGFIIERRANGEPTMTFNITDPNTKSFIDTDIYQCIAYSYRVFSRSACFPDGVPSAVASGSLLSDLNDVFPNTDDAFIASKGEYPDKIELRWRNTKPEQTSVVLIYRRPLGTSDDYSLLTSQNNYSGIYIDESADAGILYEYRIVAQGPCLGVLVESNSKTSIGFRRKSGIVSGRVYYEGGVAVPGVRILASSINETLPVSIRMTGLDSMIIPKRSVAMTLSTGVSFEAWIRPETFNSDFEFFNNLAGASASYDSGNRALVVRTAADELTMSIDSLPLFEWNHLAIVFSHDAIIIYINGEQVSRSSISQLLSGTVFNTDLRLFNKYIGALKDIRIWSKALSTSEVATNYNRLLSGKERNLICYLPVDEAFGSYLYDLSNHNNLYNKNHARLARKSLWNTDFAPSRMELGVAGISDVNGNYTLVVPYTRAGETFVLTPFYETHQFEPSSRAVFIGDGASVINNVDFKDISSFQVSGTVRFANSTCPSTGVMLNIDGQVVVRNGEPVMTDQNGFFQISVPIGNHFISLSKSQHEFSEGRWPRQGTFDFQRDIRGIAFIDSSIRTVVGRVVGGQVEANKKIGFHASKNNIGQAIIAIDPLQQCTINGLDIIMDTTDIRSGEYRMDLPPLAYQIQSVVVPNNNFVNFGSLPIIDLTNLLADGTVIKDSTRVSPAPNDYQVDSLRYHVRQDFIFRQDPTVLVTLRDKQTPFKGDSVIAINTGDVFTEVPAEALGTYYPIFTQAREYDAVIHTYELYENFDDPDTTISERVPLKAGELLIENRISSNTASIRVPVGQDGLTYYSFKAGDPNLAINGTYPSLSYSSPFYITMIADDNIVEWQPFQVDGDTPDAYFRGVVLGNTYISEASFVTQGPEVVDYILRDPPGSQSYARLEKGTKISTLKRDYDVKTKGGGFNTKIFKGIKYSSGLAWSTETESHISTGNQFDGYKTTITDTTELQSLTLKRAIQTSDLALLPGEQSDIFIGGSKNYLFGITKHLSIIPDANCSLSIIESCYDLEGPYAIASENAIAIAEGDFETQFVYTRNKIETEEIPDLVMLRNQLLERHPGYQSLLPADHPCYGFNNDDERLIDPYTCPNSIGESYTVELDITNQNDSIRMLNQQIKLWEAALERDEREKFLAKNPVNISFGGGGTEITDYFESTGQLIVEDAVQETFNLEIAIGGKLIVAGNGGEVNAFSRFEWNYIDSDIITEDSTTIIQYTLRDNDEWDDFNVQVYDGGATGGPIFKTLAGYSSCPHEPRVRTKYYLPGTIINPGTVQLERPKIEVTPSVIYNVPQDSRATFTMELTNENPVGDQWLFYTHLIEKSNPNGARINLGTDDNLTNEWSLPAQTTLSRDFFVEIGNGYKYDSLLVILHSGCQYQSGVSDQVDIVDSAYFSVNFIPGCTDVSIKTPLEKWTVNNSFENNLEIKIDGYDINYLNLDHIQLEYKPTSESTWRSLQKFYFDLDLVKDPNGLPLSKTNSTTNYLWKLNSLADGWYDIRTVSDCKLATNVSAIHTGRIDRVNPAPFGQPSPIDGVLDPDDQISIQFNEPIDEGAINLFNMDVRGVLNGSPMRHAEYLYMDGNNDYASIPPYQLQKRDWTIEMWLHPKATREQIVWSQGISGANVFQAGFDANGSFFVDYNGSRATSTQVALLGKWYHFAVNFDNDLRKLTLYQDFVRVAEISLAEEFLAEGDIFIGSANGTSHFYNGNIRDLRLWSIKRTAADFSSWGNRLLPSNQLGLIGHWLCNDLEGSVAQDRVRSRHMELVGPSWGLSPTSHSVALDGGSEHLCNFTAGTLVMAQDEDVTIEMWFKTATPNRQHLLSNGPASVSDPSYWEILMDNGQLIVKNNAMVKHLAPKLDDDKWHHLAIVVNRNSAVLFYVDGDLVSDADPSACGAFGSSRLCLGALVQGMTSMPDYTNHFTGNIDEVRIWNIARQAEQIRRDRRYQLLGEEPGLMAYYPFDAYKNELGVEILTTTLADKSNNQLDLIAPSVRFETSNPGITLPRPVEQLRFNYSTNHDKIIIELTEAAHLIENTIIDFTVSDIRDLTGNRMRHPKTWTAFIDKNQVFWDEEYKLIQINNNENGEFVIDIINDGGKSENFSITNLPTFITAHPSQGTLSPKSSLPIRFVVSSQADIGTYEEDIYLRTESFQYNERLLLDLDIAGVPPDWTINSADYNSSMNIIAEVLINERIVTDERSILSVWINDELRGMGHIELDERLNKYLCYLTVFSNSSIDGELEFRLWDARRALTVGNMAHEPITFIENTTIGSRSKPFVIRAIDFIEINYSLNKGWNWISFPLSSKDLTNIDAALYTLPAATGDLIKSQEVFASYDGKWKGTLSSISNKESYKLKVDSEKSFSYLGEPLQADQKSIPLAPGWNWIPYHGLKKMSVATALSSIEPASGSVIKGQRTFAIYEEGFGWGGTLTYLEPLSGYVLYHHQHDELTYPTEKSSRSVKTNSQDPAWAWSLGGYSSNMSMIATPPACLMSQLGYDAKDWLLVAYAGKEIRGISQLTLDHDGVHRYYLSVEGDDLASLQFELVHINLKSAYALTDVLDYHSNSIIGSISKPYEFSCTAALGCPRSLHIRSYENGTDQFIQEFKAVETISLNGLMREQRHYRFQSEKEVIVNDQLFIPTNTIVEIQIGQCHE